MADSRRIGVRARLGVRVGTSMCLARKDELMADLGDSRSVAHVALLVLSLLPAGCQSVERPADDGRVWWPPEPIAGIAADYRPSVALDGQGNAIAVWDRAPGFLGDEESIIANRSTLEGGWGDPEYLEDEAGAAVFPLVAMDAAGNAIALWRQSDGLAFHIWASRYTRMEGWQAPAQLDDLEHDAIDHQLDVSPRGDAIAVWRQSDGTKEKIWSNHFTPDGGWGTAQRVDNGDTDAKAPVVAIDALGNAVAVWQQFSGSRSDLLSNRYAPETGWGTQEPVERNIEGDAEFPDVAVDPEGTATAVWQQDAGDASGIWASRSAVGAGWDAAQRIDSQEGPASRPQVGVDDYGLAVVVWAQLRSSRQSVFATQYLPARGWEQPRAIETDEPGDALFPKLAMNREGSAVAVWAQFDGARRSMFSSRYAPNEGWSRHQKVENDDTYDVEQPAVAINEAGDGIAVWFGSGDTNQIWASRLMRAREP